VENFENKRTTPYSYSGQAEGHYLQNQDDTGTVTCSRFYV